MAASPQAQAKNVGIAFLKEARAAGWARAKIQYSPDGSVSLDASMADENAADDFDTDNLKMGS